MEPHPIPQNITAFEFHLVGDMTLKQFVYLGAGLGIAYLLYAGVFYSWPFIAAPLIIISVALGVSFAFLPIFDRPLDHWVRAFFSAVYSPTKGLWQNKLILKQKIRPDDPIFKKRLDTFLSSQGMSVNAWEDQTSPSPAPISAVSLPQNPQSDKKTPAVPSNQKLTELVEMARQAQILQTKIADTEKLIKQMTAEGKSADLPGVSDNLQHLIQQTEELYKKTAEMNKVTALPVDQPKSQPQPIVMPKQVVNPKVTVVQAMPHQEATIILTSTPNVINGIITDQAGNYLENVIVIIHNKEGIPVRALKTNRLGQFVGSTSLPSGVYTVTMEKEGYIFQTLEITLDNSTISPIKIVAGKGGA